MLYDDEDAFLAGASRFLRDGFEAGEPSLVIVDGSKIDALRDALGADAGEVEFRDMHVVGSNPGRVLAVWRSFVIAHSPASRGFRGIGEPVWLERTRDELDEWARHEALVDYAFHDGPAWSLMCPYDVSALGADVIDEARANHAIIATAHDEHRSDAYRGIASVALPFDRPLTEPTGQIEEMPFAERGLPLARAFAASYAGRAGFAPARIEDFVFAVNEILTNSIRYGGGAGLLRMWHSERGLVAEVRDGGRITDPLAGRFPPDGSQEGGFGLYLANSLCDLVQLRSFADGSVVRLHMSSA